LTRNRLLLLAAALLFSTGGAAIKATALTSWQVACFRSAVAGAALALLFPDSRRLRDRRALAAGVAYAATMVLFVAANKLTTSANAIFLQDTAPLYLLLLGPLLLREPLRARDLILAAVVGLGMSLFFLGQEQAVATPRIRRAATWWRLSPAWPGRLLSRDCAGHGRAAWPRCWPGISWRARVHFRWPCRWLPSACAMPRSCSTWACFKSGLPMCA
jgi:hypothetical protein